LIIFNTGPGKQLRSLSESFPSKGRVVVAVVRLVRLRAVDVEPDRVVGVQVDRRLLLLAAGFWKKVSREIFCCCETPKVDVMITILCVFLKNQCYEQFFALFSFVLNQKN
jgi:hypothetical protein